MTNKSILEKANSCLKEATYAPKKLIFLHAGVAAAVTFLGSLISYLTTHSMDAAVGLAGLDTRTALSFFRSLLLMATAVALPFWDLGYNRAAVLYAKGQTPTPPDLLCGFRRIFPALRMMLLRLMVVGAVGFLSVQAATLLFMLSPLSLKLKGQLESLVLADATLTEEVAAELMPQMVPVYILWAVIALALLIPLFYRFRLADLALMDHAPGARAAFQISNAKTRGRRLQLFKLDLHFWWYYALSLLIAAVSYLDIILPRLGVTLSEDVGFWVFFLLGLLGNLALHIFCTPKVQTAYALFLIDN